MKQKFMISKIAVEALVTDTQLTFAKLEKGELELTDERYMELDTRLFHLLQLGLITRGVYKEYASFLGEHKRRVMKWQK